MVFDNFLFEGEQLEIAWKRLVASISKGFPSNEVPNVKQVPNEVPNEVPRLKQGLST